jgi:carboxyl-terminal processing protease
MIFMRGKMKQMGLVFVGLVAGVLISLNFQAVADRAARSPLPVEELRAFTEVFGAIKTNYVEPVEDKKLITEAINGMLSGLDPHSAYLDAEAFRELQVGTQGQFGGLGIEVGMEDGFVKVISPIEDTPAFRAGIKPGDLIIKLDETAVKGMTLNDAVKKMRGKPNTQITLTVTRKGEAQPLVFTLTRAVIRVQSVKSKVIEPGYAWVRVSQFQEATAESLVRHLDNLFKQGLIRAWCSTCATIRAGCCTERSRSRRRSCRRRRWSSRPTAAMTTHARNTSRCRTTTCARAATTC